MLTISYCKDKYNFCAVTDWPKLDCCVDGLLIVDNKTLGQTSVPYFMEVHEYQLIKVQYAWPYNGKDNFVF